MPIKCMYTHTFSQKNEITQYHKQLLPDAAPFPQCSGNFLHQGHLCRGHDLFISIDQQEEVCTVNNFLLCKWLYMLYKCYTLCFVCCINCVLCCWRHYQVKFLIHLYLANKIFWFWSQRQFIVQCWLMNKNKKSLTPFFQW